MPNKFKVNLSAKKLVADWPEPMESDGRFYERFCGNIIFDRDEFNKSMEIYNSRPSYPISDEGLAQWKDGQVISEVEFRLKICLVYWCKKCRDYQSLYCSEMHDVELIPDPTGKKQVAHPLPAIEAVEGKNLNWDDLLKSVGSGKMPEVEIETALKYTTSNIGKVTVIKDNGRHRGIGVLFPGLNYDTWFHDSNDTDKRSHYLRELKLIQ